MPWQNNGGGQKNPWGGGPSGGKGGGGGPRGPQPPNFDEMIKRGQERLKDVLPGGRGGKSILILGLFIVVLGWLATGMYTVQPNQQGVVLRFGEWTETTFPGLHWHIPYPIETVLRPNVTEVNQLDIGFRANTTRGASSAVLKQESLMLTGDENIVDIEFSVLWVISDAGKYLFNIEDPQVVTIKAVAESVMRELVGQRPIQSTLTGARREIEVATQEHLQEVLDGYGAGVLIQQVKMARVDPPDEVIDSFRDVQAAAADRDRFLEEAARYSNSLKEEVDGEVQRITLEASGYHDAVIAEATGQAQRFISVYDQYKLAKDITVKRIYLETMEEVFADMNKIILGNDGAGVVPYLPLPEINARRNRAPGGQSNDQ